MRVVEEKKNWNEINHMIKRDKIKNFKNIIIKKYSMLNLNLILYYYK